MQPNPFIVILFSTHFFSKNRYVYQNSNIFHFLFGSRYYFFVLQESEIIVIFCIFRFFPLVLVFDLFLIVIHISHLFGRSSVFWIFVVANSNKSGKSQTDAFIGIDDAGGCPMYGRNRQIGRLDFPYL